MRGLQTIDRYVAREVIGPFAMGVFLLTFALVTGKQAHDKRQSIKDRDWQRQRARLLSHRR